MKKFEYEERLTCICGQFLTNSGDQICKDYSWGNVKFVKCKECGSWCQSPQIALGSLVNWFNSPEYQGSISQAGVAYVNYLKDETHRLKEAHNRYDRYFKDILPLRAKVLEVGCATGSFLSVLRGHGHEVAGVDVSSVFVEAAKDFHGLDVMLGDINSINLIENYYDAIILLGTIGNLQNLSNYLINFRKLLKHSGLFVFNYVDADSLIVKYLYRSRFWMFTPSVNCFMSGRGCKVALSLAGFRLSTICIDMQRPSFQKLFNHAGLSSAIRVLKFFRLENQSLPFPIPIPGVKLVTAKCGIGNI